MKMKKVLILCLVFALSIMSLAACGNSGGSGDSGDSASGDAEATADAPAAPGDEGAAGFEEFPIGDDQELGPLNVAGVYFQPVDMDPSGMSLPASESDMHMEADISALDGNDLGYGKGDFVPNLTVSYEIEDANGEVNAGTFMPMSASDGPHYGANIKMGDAGTYKVRFIIESPEKQGYLLHTDATTGVPGSFWTEPLVAEWDFDYVPREW
jgi:uncharacterized protein involved in high-affinity Fe2+ transport